MGDINHQHQSTAININELTALVRMLPDREQKLVLQLARGLASRSGGETHSES